MKMYLKTSVGLALFAMLLTATLAPTATAITTTDSSSSFDATFSYEPGYDFGDIPSYVNDSTTDSGSSAHASSSTYTTCTLWASHDLVTTGESVTLSWDAPNFSDITINDEPVSGTSGETTFHNLQENTLFTLKAIHDNGSTCIQEVFVNCIPPTEPARCSDFGYDFTVAKYRWTGSSYTADYVRSDYAVTVTGSDTNAEWSSDPAVAGVLAKAGTDVADLAGGTTGNVTKADIGSGTYHIDHLTFCGNTEPTQCQLDIDKTVDTHTAEPNDELTYTITIENTGTADCTGGGVLIEDAVDNRVSYLRHELSDNLSAGYGGKPVYTAEDRTLRFNAGVLQPGESGTITWVGAVHEPAVCGDFVVTNQARATAAELDTFHTWAQSPIVKTAIDNDCVVPKTPTCTLTPAAQTIEYGDTATLTWSTEHATEVTLSDFGNVALAGTVTTPTLFSDTAYVLTATGPGGSATCDATVDVGEPADTFATVVAHKIICTDETELPNFGTGGPDVTANTASDWVATHASCTFAPNWEFEWTDNETNDPGDTVVGSVGAPWYTFGPTDTTGNTAVTINLSQLADDQIWLREVLQASYIPFTYGLNGDTNVDDVSAEFYCNTDVLNYDNRERISGLAANETYYCVAWNAPVPSPSCDSFAANPSSIRVGASTTLSWETTNAEQVFINNGIGEVARDGSIQVAPLADIVYELTVVGEEEQVSCQAPVTVSADSVPVCEVFTATPNNFPASGGVTTLHWEVSDATDVSISPAVGTVASIGTTSVSVTEPGTFTLTATDADGDQTSCVAPVTVADSVPPLTCRDHVTFTASDNSIRRGDNVTLSWNTSNVDSVSINRINATSLSGNTTVSPADDITYTLTATRGSEQVACPLTIAVSSGGGGGGGGASPRCELTISDDTIQAGEEIELEWETSNARELFLRDDENTTLFTTDDFLADEKERYLDGSITLRPTRDTEYTLTVERGSRDRECTVDVSVTGDEVVVLQTRDQQPLVAGISLSEVPYTGFAAGPMLTALFYTLLILWALYITYLIVIRKQLAGSAGSHETVLTEGRPGTAEGHAAMRKAEAIRPDAFAPLSTVRSTEKSPTPGNLPTGAPAVGYDHAASPFEQPVHPERQATDTTVTELENRAHSQQTLLSSDAVRYFISTTTSPLERNETLDTIIAEAKKHYPLEDGWMVINEERMRHLCTVCNEEATASSKEPFIPATVPEGTGSLAEAIVTGNVVAAYKMIGNRPMFSLADAAADLDAVYRRRQDQEAPVSTLLLQETEHLSEAQIKDMITALTSALDGTYTDEAAAVKMAIMKAVKAGEKNS